MSQVTISGAISGLDTAGIISQLVAVQTNQQTILKSQQTAVQKRADAFSSLTTSLKSLGTQAADLARTSAWSGATATSSSTSVTVTPTGTATNTLRFDVTSVAAGHSLISAGVTAAVTDLVASEPLTLTKDDGSETSIDVGSGSLTDVVAAINASESGLVALAVRTAPGEYRLQVTSSTSGSGSAFTLDGIDGFDVAGMNILSQGTDAELTIGTTSPYTVTSSTNTFADLIPGMSFTVSKLETGVTVATTIDGSSVADKISTLVDAANGILSDIATKTAYDTTTKTGGPLTGQSAVRSLQQNILSIVSGAAAPGVRLTRDGKLTFDRTTFLSSFAADPAKVATSFGASLTFAASSDPTSTTATLSNALASARAGTYDLQVDTVPVAETWQFDPAGGDVSGQTLSLTTGTTAFTWTAGSGVTVAEAASALNTQLAAAGIGITAAADGSSLVLTASRSGTAGAFEAALDDEPGTRTAEGTDISGSIDGQTATGIGSVLSLPSGSGGAVGLSIDVATTDDDVAATDGAIGSVTYLPGLAQRLSTLVNDATADSVGLLSTAQTSANTEVKRFQTAIDSWDARLEAYRQTLTRQFTAMETALAKLKSATSALSGLIDSSSSSSSSG